jgi:hypothetical protein
MTKLDNEELNKTKVMDSAWPNIRDSYLSTLVKDVIDPTTWVNNEYPMGEPGSDIARKAIINGKYPLLEGMYTNALKLSTPKVTYELPLITLENHLKNKAIGGTELECLKMVVGAGHGKIVRDFTRLMFGVNTK